MDILTFLRYAMAIVETASLIAALVYATRSIKEKKDSKNSDLRKNFQLKSVIFFAVYLSLNILRKLIF